MIELIKVKAGYGETVQLFSIGCRIEQGTITAVIGPNGSGKSTLLKTILGMTNRQQGKVVIDGKDLNSYRREELARKIAFLPQSRNVPSITVERMILHGRFPYLSYPRNYSKRDYALVENALMTYQLMNLRSRQLNELSGGERQKVYLAMASVQESEYYFFDEPTTYLDIVHQFEVMDSIRQLKQQGKTCIVVLHDLEAALRIADQILLLDQGKLIFQGESKELLSKKCLEEVFHISVRCLKEESGEIWYRITPKQGN